MEAKAFTKTVRVSPFKARLVADKVRGVSYPEALDILRVLPQKSADIIFKTVSSAGANAKVINPQVNDSDLYVKKITVDESVIMKRFCARARGRASRIKKRTSHVTVILSDE